MAEVDAWAETGAGYDCRDTAIEEVNFLLERGDYFFTDEQIVDCAIDAWLEAE